jgi:hypothetical protein
MKNDESDQNNPNTSDEVPAATSGKNQPRKKPNKPKSNKSKSGKYKNEPEPKSLRRSWRAASPLTKIGIVVGSVAATATLGYFLVTVWQTLEVRSAAHAQHMPLLINSRPPILRQPFVCDVKNGLHTGNIETGVKNLGTAMAYHVMPYMFEPKVVPERKTGNPFFDSLPEANCKLSPTAEELESPLAPGQEIRPQLRQMVGSLPPITDTDPIQLYWVACVYYGDEYGGKHATCDTYRLALPSSNPLDSINGSPTFFCDATSKIGRFEPTATGHCHQDQ